MDLLKGRRVDPTFYPVVYSLPDDADWTDEANWYLANPSLGYTVPIERMREAFQQARGNPAEENVFRTLRLSQWVGSTVAWIPEHIYEMGNTPIDPESLEGRDCYAGLDLSSSGDITALVLMFPPRDETEKYVCLPFFWVPEETVPIRVRRASVPYDNWVARGFMYATPVIYPLSVASGKFKFALELNPLTPIFEAFKYGCLGCGSFSVGGLLYSTIFMLVTLFLAVIVFNRVERNFMDTV